MADTFNLIQTLQKLRDDLKLWSSNNFRNVLSKLSSHEGSAEAHSDIRQSISEKQNALILGDYIDITNNIIDVKNIDSTVTSGSPNLITSAAVFSAIAAIPVFDSSSYYTKTETDEKISAAVKDLPTQNTTYTFADGTNGTFTVTPSGGTAQTVSVGAANYTLPAATSAELGGVKIGANISVAADGTISTHDAYVLPGTVLHTTDVISDITSGTEDDYPTDKPVSAKQAKILDDRIKAIGDIAAGSGNGDMLKAIYDPNNDGKVISAESADEAQYAETADWSDYADKAGRIQTTDTTTNSSGQIIVEKTTVTSGVSTTKTREVAGTTGDTGFAVDEGIAVYQATGSVLLPTTATNVTISSGSISDYVSNTVTFNTSTGMASYTLYSDQPNSLVQATISYAISSTVSYSPTFVVSEDGTDSTHTLITDSDITNYYTKSEVDAIIEELPIGEIPSGCATITYVDGEILELQNTITNTHYTKSEIDTKLEALPESGSDISNGGTINGNLAVTGDLTIDGELQLSGSELTIADTNNNAIASFDKDGLTVTKINVQSDTDNFVKNFTFDAGGFYELDNNRDIIRTIILDTSAEDSWECFYEYFRQSIFQMNENSTESCVGYFTRQVKEFWLPTKLSTYFSAIQESIDSFKIELLGAVEAAAECSMIVTVYTTSAITYSLQIYHSNGNYVTNGWRCDNIKTINGESLYGIGNIDLESTGGTGSSVIVDDSLSTVSTNPVQNTVITNALNSKANSSDLDKYALKQTTSPYYSYKYSPTSPYFTRVSANGEDVDTISTDISLSIDEAPTSNPYSILYEYFRTTVLKMKGHYNHSGNIAQDGPITTTAQFIPGNNMFVDLGLSLKLQSWFVYSISADSLIINGPIDLDSFKVELLGGPNTAAECTMIITAYTKQSESYELQVVATDSNYISKGWVKKDYHNYATTDYVDNAIPDQVQFATYLGDNSDGGWQLYLSKIDESHINKLDSSWNLCPSYLQPIQLDPGTYLAIVDVVNSHSNMGNYCTSYTDIITIAEGLGSGGGVASYHVENCTGKVHTYCSYRYQTPYQMSSVRLQSDHTYGYDIIQVYVSGESSSTMTYDLMLPSTKVFEKERVSCRVWIKKIISPSLDLPTE